MNKYMNIPARAASFAMFTHGDSDHFDHAVRVAGRVAEDGRANEQHVATAYLLESKASLSELVAAGIPGDVARAVAQMVARPNEQFLAYLRRICEDPITALVCFHDFEERVHNVEGCPDDVIRRFRLAIRDLNDAVNSGTPKAN